MGELGNMKGREAGVKEIRGNGRERGKGRGIGREQEEGDSGR